MWHTHNRSQLRVVERAHEEWMVEPLDGADLSRRMSGCNAHSMLAGDVLHLGREPVRARCVLDGMPAAVQPSFSAIWAQMVESQRTYGAIRAQLVVSRHPFGWFDLSRSF